MKIGVCKSKMQLSKFIKYLTTRRLRQHLRYSKLLQPRGLILSVTNIAVTKKILSSSSLRNAPGPGLFSTIICAQINTNVYWQLILQCYCDYINFKSINMTTNLYQKSCTTDHVLWKRLHSCLQFNYFPVVLVWHHAHSGGDLIT